MKETNFYEGDSLSSHGVASFSFWKLREFFGTYKPSGFAVLFRYMFSSVYVSVMNQQVHIDIGDSVIGLMIHLVNNPYSS